MGLGQRWKLLGWLEPRGLGLGYWCFCFFVVGFQLEAGGTKRNEKRAGQVCVVAVGAEGGKMDAMQVTFGRVLLRLAPW